MCPVLLVTSTIDKTVPNKFIDYLFMAYLELSKYMDCQFFRVGPPGNKIKNFMLQKKIAWYICIRFSIAQGPTQSMPKDPRRAWVIGRPIQNHEI